MYSIIKNRKSKITYLLPVLIFFLFLTACTEWLSIEPQGSLVEEEFWTKKEDIEAVLATSYSKLKNTVVPSFIWGELRADIVSFTGTDFADYQKIADVDIRPTNGAIKWSDYYNTINMANTVLFYSPQMQDIDERYNEEVKNGIEAEAIFIRSLCYFYLVKIWKDVPLILQPSISDTMELFPAKSTEHEILNQLINDLEEAKNKAFVNQLRRENEDFFRGRANKYAITALLADIYLWNEQYEKCIENCNLILSSNYYTLLPVTKWFEIYYPGNSSESIFELQYDYTIEQENAMYGYIFPSVKSTNIKLERKSDLFTSSDVRKCGSKGPVWKYQGLKDFSTYRQNDEKDANIVYYRLADVYLMKAEALTELNKINEANACLKTISDRANALYINATEQADLRLRVLDERAKEFAVEGKRWFDILRYAKRNNFENKSFIINMVLAKLDVKQKAILRPRLLDTMSYFLPIPERDILSNPNLEQNPYYDR